MSELLKPAAVILAAGGSRRLGRAKQFLVYQGISLIRRAVLAAGQVDCAPIVVVAGSEHQRLKDELAGLPVHVAVNADWDAGIGSSIACGFDALAIAAPECAAAFILLCDQPLVGASTLGRLLSGWTGRCVRACAYDQTIGPPVLAPRRFFPQLRNLPPHSGAKSLWQSSPAEVESITCDEARWDIDTESDYARLRDGEPAPDGSA